MKTKYNIPFKEKQRHYDYRDNQWDRQEEMAIKKENKYLRKLKQQALKEQEA